MHTDIRCQKTNYHEQLKNRKKYGIINTNHSVMRNSSPHASKFPSLPPPLSVLYDARVLFRNDDWTCKT